MTSLLCLCVADAVSRSNLGGAGEAEGCYASLAMAPHTVRLLLSYYDLWVIDGQEDNGYYTKYKIAYGS